MNLIDVMGLGTVALRGICRLNVRFGSNSEIQPDCNDDFSPRRRSGSRFNRGQDPACGGGMLESAGFDLAVGSLSDLAK